MRAKTFLYLVVIVIALIVFAIRFLVDNVTGCTSGLRSRFENTKLAQTYQDIYIQQLVEDKRITEVIDYGWTIHKQGDGCIVQFTTTALLGSVMRTNYEGDKFFINLDDRNIYPQTEGAKLFMDTYRVDTKLP